MRSLISPVGTGSNNFSETEVAMNTFNGYTRSIRRFAIAILAMMTLVLGPALASAYAAQKSFSSPEEAVDALLAAARSGDRGEMLKLFGPQGEKIIFTGDKIADQHMLDGFVADFDQGHRIESRDDAGAMLYLGKDEWPFLIPLVRQGARWRFATGASMFVIRLCRNRKIVIWY
jgi:hypothetical protein